MPNKTEFTYKFDVNDIYQYTYIYVIIGYSATTNDK